MNALLAGAPATGLDFAEDSDSILYEMKVDGEVIQKAWFIFDSYPSWDTVTIFDFSSWFTSQGTFIVSNVALAMSDSLTKTRFYGNICQDYFDRASDSCIDSGSDSDYVDEDAPLSSHCSTMASSSSSWSASAFAYLLVITCLSLITLISFKKICHRSCLFFILPEPSDCSFCGVPAPTNLRRRSSLYSFQWTGWDWHWTRFCAIGPSCCPWRCWIMGHPRAASGSALRF